MTATTFFAGSYASADAAGIRAFRFDPDRRQLEELGRWTGVVNPSFLALSPDRRHLYAVSETAVSDGRAGHVHAFTVRWNGGEPDLAPIGSVASGGDHPCHLGVDPAGRWIIVSNYSSGTIELVGLRPDGGFGDVLATVAFAGSGPVAARQSGPHTHSAVPSPDGSHVVVADLGADRVAVYAVESGALRHCCDAPVRPGAGPRHSLVLDDRVITANELDSTVTIYRVDQAWERLTPISTVSTLPDNVEADNIVAELRLSADGPRVYVSNRGHDSIAELDLADDGSLRHRSTYPCGGAWPRNFAVIADGRHLVVANERSDELVVLPVTDAGLGEPVARAAMPAPTYVAVV